MRFPRIRRFSGWVAFCLCMLIPVLAGCGDYCLFCDGQGGGGGGSDGSSEICDSVFSGLDYYQAALNIKTIRTFTETRSGSDRLSPAVVPKGMSFEYGSNLTANPGYVLLADQLATDVYVYEFTTTTQTQRLFDVGVDHVSGVALLHQEIDQTTAADLLLFTVEAQDTLYIYDLTDTTRPSTLVNPHPIKNSDLTGLFSGGDFFESPTAIAVRADADEAVIFVLNDNLNTATGVNDSSVRRLHVDLATWEPTSARTVGTMTESTRRLIDISIYDQTDTLYVSKKTVGEDLTVGWVYRIDNASARTGSVNLNPDSSFIAGDGAPTGLTAAFTNKAGTAAALLVLSEGDGQVIQYDIDSGGSATAKAAFALEAFSLYPQAIAYDCTNERLVMTDIPFNADLNRTLFEAFPTQ